MKMIKIVNRSNNPIPTYKHDGDAGFDLRANLSDNCSVDNLIKTDNPKIKNHIVLGRHSRVLVPTGLYIQLPEGYELQIRPRRDLALKYGIGVLNTPGTIDSSYRSEIGIILHNTTNDPFIINDGDRIAQAVVNKFETVFFTEVDSLDETKRDTDGFGSTGIK